MNLDHAVLGDTFLLPEKLVMTAMDSEEDPDFDSFFADAPYLLSPCQDDPSCPPPVFTMPAPPRPPWMEQGCPANSPHESCDNILIIDSQIQLQETFQNLTIIAVCAAILVIMLVITTAVIWRLRKSGSGGCRYGSDKRDCCSTLDGPSDLLEMKTTNEVYDNPNYSHILIGGRPFFILPSGELSEHVPVPRQGELLTPQHTQAGDLGQAQSHVYEPGSSTYRSGSDYDTESSTYRPDSEGGTGPGFPPIYEEIDKCSSAGDRERESVFQGTEKQAQGQQNRETLALPHRFFERPEGHHGAGGESWTWQQDLATASPPAATRGRQPNSRYRPGPPANPGSVYYYSDTLRRKAMPGLEGGRDSVQESDSGVSSRSGHNTSSESTPQPVVLGARTNKPQALSSDEDNPPGPDNPPRLSRPEPRLSRLDTRPPVHPEPKLFHPEPRLSHPDSRTSPRCRPDPRLCIPDPRLPGCRPDPVDTQVIVRNVSNTGRREPRVNL